MWLRLLFPSLPLILTPPTWFSFLYWWLVYIVWGDVVPSHPPLLLWVSIMVGGGGRLMLPLLLTMTSLGDVPMDTQLLSAVAFRVAPTLTIVREVRIWLHGRSRPYSHPLLLSLTAPVSCWRFHSMRGYLDASDLGFHPLNPTIAWKILCLICRWCRVPCRYKLDSGMGCDLELAAKKLELIRK